MRIYYQNCTNLKEVLAAAAQDTAHWSDKARVLFAEAAEKFDSLPYSDEFPGIRGVYGRRLTVQGYVFVVACYDGRFYVYDVWGLLPQE